MSLGGALAIVLVLVLAAAAVAAARAWRAAAAGLRAWGAALAPSCGGAGAGAAPLAPECAALLAPLGAPPAAGAPAAAATYATRLLARFIAYVGTGDAGFLPISDGTAAGVAPALIVGDDGSGGAVSPLAAVWALPGGAAVAVRGTKTVADLLADLRYGQVAAGGPAMAMTELVPHAAAAKMGSPALVHRGMYGLYLGVRPALRAAVLAAAAAGGAMGPPRIFVAGHSMGAALAFYLALDLAADEAGAVEVWGVAPPRAGDAAFAAAVAAAAKAASLVNLADFVPSLPWSYSPNSAPPYAPYAYAHVQPALAFSHVGPDAGSCHALPAYFAGAAAAVPVPLA